MSESGTTTVPSVPGQHRTKLRAGFALCAGAFALALVFEIVRFGAVQLASSSETHFSETHDAALQVAANFADASIDVMLIAGAACLYIAKNERRWRQVSTAVLGLLGVDVAIVCYDAFGTDAAMAEVTRDFGLTLNWAHLWLIAVLAAEAAESMHRPDITYQTEVAGRLIIWGGVAWLAYLIWSFDPKQLGKRPHDAAIDEFGIVLFWACWTLRLLAFGRTMLFCGGLAAALSPTQDQSPPGQTVG